MRRKQSKFPIYNRIYLNPIRDQKFMDFKTKSLRGMLTSKNLIKITTEPDLDLNEIKYSNMIYNIRLPKLYFSLSPSAEYKVNEFDINKLEIPKVNTLPKLESVYQSISDLKKSLTKPKLFLENSSELNTLEPSPDAKELFKAIKLGKNQKVLRMLDAKRSLVHARDSVGKTPLHWAFIRNNLLIAQTLIAYGGDIRALDHSKRSVKDFAKRYNHTEALEFLKKYN